MSLSRTFFRAVTASLARTSSKLKTGRTQLASPFLCPIEFPTVHLQIFETQIGLINNHTDIQTLSRVTGKDFTGPTPEIRAPEVTVLAEPTSQPESRVDQPESTSSHAHVKKMRKKSRTPSAAGDAVEVLGNIDDFES